MLNALSVGVRQNSANRSLMSKYAQITTILNSKKKTIYH